MLFIPCGGWKSGCIYSTIMMKDLKGICKTLNRTEFAKIFVDASLI